MNTVKWWEWGLEWGLEVEGMGCEWCFSTWVHHLIFNGGLKTGHRVNEHCNMVGVGLKVGGGNGSGALQLEYIMRYLMDEWPNSNQRTY